MATYVYFDDVVKDQQSGKEMHLEIGKTASRDGDSLYISLDDKSALVTRADAKRIVEAVEELSRYIGLFDKQP